MSNPKTEQNKETKVVDKTLEDFEIAVAKIKSPEELDTIEASEKEGKNRTGAFEILEKRRAELAESPAEENTEESTGPSDNDTREAAEKAAQAEAQAKAEAAEKAKAKAEKKPKRAGSQKKVEILCHNAAGKYRLPYSKGHKVEIEAKQAEEMIEAGDAKEV